MKALIKPLLLLFLIFVINFSAFSQNVHEWYQDGVVIFQLKESHPVIYGDHEGNVEPQSLHFLSRYIDHYEIKAVTHKHPDIRNEALRRTYQVDFAQAEMVDDFIKTLGQHGEFEYVEKKELHIPLYSPNDPVYQNGNMWGLTQINAEEAWDISTGSSDIVVAVTDNAIHTGHPDLVNMMVGGYDAADGGNDPTPCGGNDGFHGTHVSGTVGAETDNGIGVASIGFGVSIMPVKIGRCSDGALTGGYEGIQWAANNGADVINMSWGGGGSSQYGLNVCNNAYNQGAVLIAAAGNNNSNQQFYPAAYNSVVAVASTTTGDVKSGFSQYGTWIDVSAPGSQIASTDQNDGYQYSQGTSMASPLVAGLAGLIKSHAPTMTNADIVSCLISSTDNIDGANPNYVGLLGSGRVNAEEALLCASAFLSELDAGITNIIEPDGQICSEEVTPQVTLRNFGSNTLTSVTINYQLDNGPVQNINWTGSLAQGQTETVTLPLLAVGSGTFDLSVYTSNPNGGTDENPINDESTTTFATVADGEEVYLTVISDCYGDETTWEIIDEDGNVVHTGGPYAGSEGNPLTGGATYEHSLCLASGCYTFIIYDSYGDGMNGSQWQGCGVDGDYYIVDEDGNNLVEMTAANANFGNQASHDFCTAPTSSVDAGITQIYNPSGASCQTEITPEVRLRNFGGDDLTSVTINYQVNGGPVQTYSWSGNLTTSQTENITLPAVTVAGGLSIFTAYTSNPNGGTDENPANDDEEVTFMTYTSSVSLPFTEDFESNSFTDNNWFIDNPDNDITWEIYTVQGTTPGDKAAGMNIFNYGTAGERDALITPPLDFTGHTDINLSFEHAYRRFDQSASDSLIVYISTDCGETYSRIFQAGEDGTGSFATAATNTTPFTPTNVEEWCIDGIGAECFSVNLDQYIGEQQVFIKFESYNAGETGNNMYLDNINIDGTPTDDPPVPNFSASNQDICEGGDVTFTDQSQNNPDNWEWEFQGGNPATSTDQNPVVTYNNPGTFEVTLTVSNSSGTETLTETSYITVTEVPEVSAAGGTTICEGEETTLTASGADSYLWSPAGSLTSTTGASVVAFPSQTTVYTVEGSIGSCSDQSQVTVTVTPSPEVTISASNTEICADGDATLTATGADSYEWSPAGSLDNTTGASVVANPSETTTYTVIGTTDGCETTVQITIIVDENATPNVVANATNMEICEGESVILSANGGDTYEWSPSGTLSQSTGNQVSATPTETTTYTVEGTTSCGTGEDQITIVVNEVPDEPVIIQADNTLSVDAQGHDVQWHLNGVPIPGANQEELEITEDGFYMVTLTTEDGCEVSSEMFEGDYTSVNEFSQNSMNIYPNPMSSEFFIELDNAQQVQITVFNAVGQLIHSSQHTSTLIHLNSNNWSDGMYMVRIASGDSVVTKKLVKN